MDLAFSPSLVETAAVLAACGLPSNDIEPQFLEHFVIARDEAHRPVGIAGVQLIGDKGLLRSVAVVDAHRSAGLGARLVRTIEAHARDAGVIDLFLFTTDAQQFFAGHGYVEVPRREAPAELRATTQFGSDCCAAATLMRKRLTTS